MKASLGETEREELNFTCREVQVSHDQASVYGTHANNQGHQSN